MKKIFIVLLSLTSQYLFSQTNTTDKNEFYNAIPTVVEDQIFKIEILNPGFVYEKGLNENSTFYAGISANFGIPVSDRTNFDVYSILYPTIDLQYRHYYNLDKRKSKFKNFTNNSGQYVAAKFEAYTILNSTEAVERYNRAGVGGVWGFQKNGKPITFNFEIGLGLGTRNFTFTNYPELDREGFALFGLGKLSLGILIANKNNKYKEYLSM